MRVLETCPGCPGVLELARLADEKPRVYDGAPAPEPQKQRHRRRINTMRGRPGKAAVSESNTVTLAEVMGMTSRSRRYLRGALKDAGIQVVGLGQRVADHGRPPSLYPRDQVMAWIEKRKITHPSAPCAAQQPSPAPAAPITRPAENGGSDILRRMDVVLEAAKSERDAVTKRIEALEEARTALARVEALIGEKGNR